VYTQTIANRWTRFRALKKLDHQAAVDTFEKYKDFYHPICRGMVEKDLAK
jgi:leukotriene-A4 hydrolase